jgi:hypothetical protein
MQPTLSTCVLLLNAVWDFVSALAILIKIPTGQCTAIANAHLLLWTDEADQTNSTAMFLLSTLLTQWAIVRLCGALYGPKSDVACTDAVATYTAEGALMLVMVVTGKMHVVSGWFVVIACGVCIAVVRAEC